MSNIQERLDRLSPEKRALLEQMLLSRSSVSSRTCKIPKCDPGSKTQLSLAEQRLWFVDRLEPNHPFYNMPLAARIDGPIDRPAFSQAIQAVVDRHETLRCTYHLDDGVPQRRISDTLRIEPQFVSINGALDEPIRSLSRQPFDIETGPLFRVTVLQNDTGDLVVLLVMHHIVSDGWSMIVMLQEIGRYYDAFVKDPDADASLVLQPLPLQYSDFAAWQADQLSEQVIEDHLRYWRNQLTGAPRFLELPTDYPRPAIQDFDGATFPLALAEQTSSRIRSLAAQIEGTPFMILLAAQAVLLSRYARQEEVVLGSAAANRSEPELEELIGFFVSTLPLRLTLSGDPTFRELLQQAREVVIGAFDHASLPFEKLVEELAASRDRSYSPIFQSALVMQNLPRDFASAGGNIEPIQIDNGTAKYDLTLFLWEEHNQFIGHVEYRTRLFREASIAQFVESFEKLLNAALAEPDLPVSELPILTESQRKTVIEDFNDTGVAVVDPQRLHALFEHHVERCPDANAIREHGTSTTHRELNDAANRIATALISRGVQKEQPVVVALPRSRDLVCVMLGILKAGGVYVPIDPTVPASRIADISNEVQPKLAVLESDLLGHIQLQNVPTATVANLIEESNFSAAASFPCVDPHDCAYMIFTSGSTGVPKGVQIEHRSIVNFVRAQTAKMGVKSDDRVLHAFSPSFDGSLSEIILALANGATLVIADAATVLDPKSFTKLLNDERVTVGKFPPALLSMLDPNDLPHLKTVASAGDKLTGELASRWIRGRRFFNGYGPTEAAVGASMMELNAETITGKPAIGGPMQNMRMYVLDRRRQPVPIGIPGEIYIGGMGVGRGYVNQPELTESCFMSDPFVKSPVARMYRTGDVGRWRNDGVIEFLGRADDQISLRGFRIEPGEIVEALSQLDFVQQAAVTVRGDDAAAGLIAYVVPAKAEEIAFRKALEDDHVEGWNSLFANAHRIAPPVLNPELNITGWISTYTGRPIPEPEMIEWADAAVNRIASLEPADVLEIGCGTGLILLRLVDQCRSYVGTDLFAASLDNIQKALDQRPTLAERVELFHQPADELTNFGDRTFDVIVMNSVCQYFPSIDYLVDVIESTSSLLKPGGRMFLGDLRNYRLCEAFAASVEHRQAAADLPIESLRSRIHGRVQHEEELMIDPRFFSALRGRTARLSSVATMLKETSADNELTRFRYDAMLEFDGPVDANTRCTYAYDSDANIQQINDVLQNSDSDRLRFTSIPNARVVTDVALAREVAESTCRTAGEVVASDIPAEAIDPNACVRIGNQHGFDVAVTWDEERPDCFEALFTRQDQRSSSIGPCIDQQSVDDTGSLSQFANNPLSNRRDQYLAKSLREELRDRLPAYMIPSSFVMLDEIPRTTNGKIDFNALPPPTARPDGLGQYQEPADELEQLVAGVWEDLLDVRPIGATDNFFELGGHSMLAVRMMSEIERTTGQTVPLAALFQEPTIEHIASILREPSADAINTPLVPLRRTDTGVPLFCVHPAGGTVFCYRELAARIKNRPIIGIQAQGIDGKSDPHDALGEMAAHYVQAIMEQHPIGTIHLAGWSLGGNIAFELARQLCEHGRDVGMLALIDAGLLNEETPLNEEDFLPLIMALFPGAQEHFSLDELKAKSPEEQLRYFTQQAAKAGIVPAEKSEQGASIFRVFQANVKSVHQYQPKYLDSTLTLIRPSEQSKTGALFDDPMLGWRDFARGVNVVHVPGDHAHMLQEPAVEELAIQLQKTMRNAEHSQ